MGGWKSAATAGVRLDPRTVGEAVDVYRQVMADWNDHLCANMDTSAAVRPICPVGSTFYWQQDLDDDPDRIYGDVDFLVELPFDEMGCLNDTFRRRKEAEIRRTYRERLADFLIECRPMSVDIESTLRGDPGQMILFLSDDRRVQVDTITTFPRYVSWMMGRYVPERGRKGLAMGKLFTALGTVLHLSVGTEGVISRTRDGVPVSSSVRRGIVVTTVSTDISRFLVDIAVHILGSEISVHPLLAQHSGLNISAVKLEDLALGILGLSCALAGVDPDLAARVFSEYETLMLAELEDPKYRRAVTADQLERVKRMQHDVMRSISDVKRVLLGTVLSDG